MVGAETFTASTSADGYSWNTAVGLTVADGQVFVARSNGTLDRIAFSAGKPTGAVTTVSGPGLDGINWRAAACSCSAKSGGAGPRPGAAHRPPHEPRSMAG